MKFMIPKFYGIFEGDSSTGLGASFKQFFFCVYRVWRLRGIRLKHLEVCFFTKNGVWQWKELF